MNKPCPFCESIDLMISFKMNYGHGDCGFDHLRVVCKTCDATRGLSNYGSPSDAEVQLAWDAWNKRVNN